MLCSRRAAPAVGVLAAAILLLSGPHQLAAQEPRTKTAEVHPAAEARGHPGTAAARAEHPPEEPVDPMKPEPTLAIWTLVVFVGLLAILTRFAWKPLMHALHEREKHLEHVLHETERARNESERLLSEHRKQMARAADEVRGLLEQARQDAQSTAENIVKAAQSEAESAKQRATRDIVAARDQALGRSGRKPPTWLSRSPGECSRKS